jgi:uncharacterized glyoxalase superfamily protein PhnB
VWWLTASISSGVRQCRSDFAARSKGLSNDVLKFASIRLIAADITSVVGFHEMVTGHPAEWLAPVFAEIVTPSATLAIGSVETLALCKQGSAGAAANRGSIIDFMVEDVDAQFAGLKDEAEVVHEPKLMPWGNRSLQFQDPEGTPVFSVHAGYGCREQAARLALGSGERASSTMCCPAVARRISDATHRA